MRAHDIFRRSLAEVKRLWKRSPVFRSANFACAEMDDPEQPGRPFVKHGPLAEIEKAWHFSRASGVPPWIRLWTGRAAREHTLKAVEEEYALTPAQRYALLDDTLTSFEFNVRDPMSWNTAWLCAIRIPSPEEIALWWWGGRDVALCNPVLRDWYFREGAEVFHGRKAFEVAQREWAKWSH
jgi:hypothetical protein